jgi:hypothetical protein
MDHMGLGPITAQPGDVICVILEGRPISSSGQWKIIIGCWGNAIMCIV